MVENICGWGGPGCRKLPPADERNWRAPEYWTEKIGRRLGVMGVEVRAPAGKGVVVRYWIY